MADLIVRFMSLVEPPLHVAGYSGFDGFTTVPVGTAVEGDTYADVAVVGGTTPGPPFTAAFYLGLTSTSRDFTCYTQWDGEKAIRTIGLYQGEGVAPAPPLDGPFGRVLPEFRDGYENLVWQFQIEELSAAHKRLLPIMVSTAFAGDIFFMKYSLPKMVLGAIVRGADGTFASTVQGWVATPATDPDGHTSVPVAPVTIAPNEATLIPIASITKTFTGHLLARLAAQGKTGFTHQVAGNPAIRLIHLATHTSGLPREVDPGIELDPAKEAQLPPVLFPPGTGALYSNVGFNVLSRELDGIGRTLGVASYGALLEKEVLSPLGLNHTTFAGPDHPGSGESDLGINVFGSHDSAGRPWKEPRHDPTPRGASGLYSTPGDILKWIEWHLTTGGDVDPVETETRLLNHAAYVQRDGLSPVFGLDESGHMDAMGLGWVVMMPKGDRPFILQKAGGTTGVFSFIAFSPARGVGFFMSVDQFDVGAGTEMPELIADLISNSAPR